MAGVCGNILHPADTYFQKKAPGGFSAGGFPFLRAGMCRSGRERPRRPLPAFTLSSAHSLRPRPILLRRSCRRLSVPPHLQPLRRSHLYPPVLSGRLGRGTAHAAARALPYQGRPRRPLLPTHAVHGFRRAWRAQAQRVSPPAGRVERRRKQQPPKNGCSFFKNFLVWHCGQKFLNDLTLFLLML